MSGAFNQDSSRVNFGNRWVHVPKPKTGGKGKFQKWKGQMVVVVSIGKSTSRMFLMEPVVTALNRPEFIGFMLAGSSVGIYAEDTEEEYKVTYENKDGPVTPNISVGFMVSQYGWRQGVYDCHVEAGGLVVFNPAGPFSNVR